MFGLTNDLLATFLLVTVRLSTAIVVLPAFGAQGTPPQTKVGLALFMALILTPLAGPVDLPPGLAPVAAAAVREALVGLAIGFAVLLVFQGLEAAGDMMGVQMGLGLGQLLDPLTGAASTEMRRFYAVLAMLIFFLANAHHEVIRGLFLSFELVPLNTFTADSLNLTALLALSAGMFVTGVRIALPVVAAVFLTDVALAVIARTMPQLNVLIVGLPVKIAVGLFVLMAALPLTTQLMHATFGSLLEDMTSLLTPAARGG